MLFLNKVDTFSLRNYVSIRKLRHVVITAIFILFLHLYLQAEGDHLVHNKDFDDVRLLKDALKKNSVVSGEVYFSLEPQFETSISVSTSRSVRLGPGGKTIKSSEASVTEALGRLYSNINRPDTNKYTDYDRLRHEWILKKLIPFHRSSSGLRSADDINSSGRIDGGEKTEPLRLKSTRPVDADRSPATSERTTFSTSKQSDYFKADFRPRWMRISDKLYIYSSFWDDRHSLKKSPFSRTIGIVKFDEAMAVKKNNFKMTGDLKPEVVNVTCYLWRTSSDIPVVGKLSVFFFEEGLNSYVGAFLKCSPYNSSYKSPTTYSSPTQIAASSGHTLPTLPSDSNFENASDVADFYAVSFIPVGSRNYPHKLSYFENPKPTPSGSSARDDSSAVCIRPLYGPYNDTSALLQFIIYYHSVLHVQTFYFYDLSMTSAVRNLFRELQKSGVDIDVLPWNLPTGGWTELWDYGTLAASNDCVYRTMGTHGYTLIVDIDEFVVPKDTPVNGMSDVYHSVLTQKIGKKGDAAVIPNAFFCSEFKGNFSPKGKLALSASQLKLPIFRHAIREGRAWPSTLRSKVILTPSTVESVGHHMVHNFVNKSFKNLAGSTHHVVLNHYRSCRGLHRGLNNTGVTVLGQPTVRDATAGQYRDLFMGSSLFKTFQYLLKA